MKEIISIYSNWRFWSFILIAFLPLWFGLIGCGYLYLKEVLQKWVNR